MKKLVTIIIPTIGRPQYLPDTVKCALEQDYENIEILISDNYSEISPENILGEGVDQKIRFVTRDRRYDFNSHMNLCIKDANGYFVMILSDDDLLTPTYISNMVKLFDTKGVMVALGAQQVIDENDNEIECSNDKGSIVVDGFQYVMDHFTGQSNFPINTYLSLFAKKIDIVDCGGFQDYADGSNADNYLFYSLAMNGKIGLSEKCLMGYRVYLGSFGLSSPFNKLIAATSDYDRDMASLIWNLKDQSFVEKMYLRYLLKRSSAFMMLARLRGVYKMNYFSLGGLKNSSKLLLFSMSSGKLSSRWFGL